MLRKIMIVLATAAALTVGLTADAFARGGGGGVDMVGGSGVDTVGVLVAALIWAALAAALIWVGSVSGAHIGGGCRIKHRQATGQEARGVDLTATGC